MRATRSGAALTNRADAAVEACDDEVFVALGTRRPAFVRALLLLRDR